MVALDPAPATLSRGGHCLLDELKGSHDPQPVFTTHVCLLTWMLCVTLHNLGVSLINVSVIFMKFWS